DVGPAGERALSRREGARDAVADRRDVPRVDIDGVVACDLRHRAALARHDGAATCERLRNRQAEALVEGGVDEAAGTTVEPRELRVADLAEPGHVAGRPNAAPAPRTDHAQLAVDGCGDARQVLARLERADGEHVVAVGLRPDGREDVVDGVRHDTDLRRRHGEQLDELALRELRYGDQPRGGTDDTRHGEMRVRAR